MFILFYLKETLKFPQVKTTTFFISLGGELTIFSYLVISTN